MWKFKRNGFKDFSLVKQARGSFDRRVKTRMSQVDYIRMRALVVDRLA